MRWRHNRASRLGNVEYYKKLDERESDEFFPHHSK
jgi:hypothetical protein